MTALTYGTSLFDLATEENLLPSYMDDLNVVRQVMADNPQFLDLLDCRAVPLKERLSVLDDCFSGKIQTYLLNFMKILCENGTIRCLPDGIRQFERLYFEACGIVEATAVSAVELAPALQQKLQSKLEKLTGKTVKLHCMTDASVLGGIRLDFAGKQFDGTLRRRLDQVAKTLSEITL